MASKTAERKHNGRSPRAEKRRVAGTKKPAARRYYVANGERIPIKPGSFLDQTLDIVGSGSVVKQGKAAGRYYEVYGKRILIRKGSFLDRVIEAVGIVKDGPADLSTNKAYFRGFGL